MVARALLGLLLLLAPPAWGAEGSRLAVICYHRFGPETAKDPYKISLKRLRAQLAWLRSSGWQGVGLTQVAAALAGQAGALPDKGVMLTVDDGYKAGGLGAQAFEDAGYRGVYFVNPGSIGGRAFLSWDDLKGLEARGHEVASHSATHPNLAKVPAGMRPAAWKAWLDGELRGSRVEIERRLGHPVGALAWPFGAYNVPLIDAAKAAGYGQLYTVSGGMNVGHPSLAAFQRHLRTLPVQAQVQGLEEGALFFRSQLPRAVRAQGDGLRAGLGGQPLEPLADGRWELPAGLKDGFHYLVLDQGAGEGLRRTPLLFQVAPDAWKACYRALEQDSPVIKRDHADRP
jgi:peptidoglycan/xylan/chitin deacetylase (PgdA/CDA1 family)